MKTFSSFHSSCLAKPSLKIRTTNAIFWISLGIFRDYGLTSIFFRNITFLFFNIESWNFQHLFEMKFSDWVEIYWGFTKLYFKKILKVSAVYLDQKKFLFLRKIFFRLLSLNMPREIQKMAFAVLIFSEGFGMNE